MKAIVKGFVVIALILGVGTFYVQTKTEGVQAFFDNYFSAKEVKEYYVVTNKPEEKGGKYLYTFHGYDKDGNEQIVKKMMGRELREGAYLRSFSKGAQGKGWHEVQKEDVPKKALEKLNKN